MVKKRLLIWIVCITALLLLFLSMPIYLKRAIIYNFVGINDYTLFENRTVTVSDPMPWPVSSKFNHPILKGSKLDTLENFQTTAFLLIQNDSIISETYWDGYDENAISNSFSMAKSIISLLVGIAIDEGFIKSIDQPVKDFLPELINKTNTDLTIRHLLNMSSGSNWEENYVSPFSMTTQAYYGTNLKKLVSEIEIINPPGKTFIYQSGNTQILAEILQRATNKSISKFASETLWKKTGAVNTALWSLDYVNGDEKAYCCFNSNARDFARLGSVVLHDGFFNQMQIVSKKYLDEMTNSASQLIGIDDNKQVNYYGLHWWIINYNGESIPYARGILGQYIFVLKKQNAVLVRLGHKRSKIQINHHPSEIYTYLDLAMDILNQ